MDGVKVRKFFRYFILALATVIFIFPLIWVFYNSFKTNSELYASPWALPENINWENFIYAWKQANIGSFFLNSVIICAVSLVLCLLLSSTAAFALTRLKWKMSGLVMSIFLFGMMMPIHATLIPVFMMFSKIGIVNTRLSLIIPYTINGLPMAIFILTGFFKSFPREIEESAVIDGASMKGVFARMVLPISKPSIATVAIYIFVSMWNELTYALVFLSTQSKMTLPIGLTYFKRQYTTNYVALFAAIIITIVPTIVIYFIFNKQVIEGMTSGAVKG